MLGEWGALGRLVERLEKVMTPAVELDANEADDYFAYVPYPLGLFLEGLHTAGHYLAATDRWPAHSQFLDVGCGIGTKMALASFLGWRVKGIELHEEYLKVCRRLVPSAPLIQANAFDLTDAYAYADLVYSYRLCQDEDEQMRLARHLTKHMAPGALLFLVGCPDPDWLGKPLGPGLWRVG
jgi:SAM-dependent methyltransferase